MKKVLLALCVSAFFIACNDNAKTDTTTTSDSTMVTAPATSDTSMVKDSTHTVKITDSTTKK